jgi:cytochrome c biogenesis protein CcdA
MSFSIKQKTIIRKFVINIFALFLIFAFLPINKTHAEESVKTSIYFTGIGCPYCAKVSPVLHEETDNGDLIVIEYELYHETSNAKVLYEYANNYDIALSIPNILHTSDISRIGDKDILNNLEADRSKIIENEILLANKKTTWENIDLNDLIGLPKIYSAEKIAIKTDSSKTSKEEQGLIKEFVLNDIEKVVDKLNGTLVEESDLTQEYPGGKMTYDYGVNIEGWMLLWNGPKPINAIKNSGAIADNGNQNEDLEQISIFKVITLALTDSINPCALSVLTMMLIGIITYHPKKPKQILLSGLAFTASVFFTYIIYGLLIVKAFELLQSISSIRTYLYNGLGALTIILGLLEIKDFFFYKPGSVGTEMPLFLRPKVQKLIARITSPIGAFGLGMFVTLFLLPCTVGPYIILGGILSVRGMLPSVPYLLLYNFIFVLPMIAIVILVYFSTDKIENINKFREDNIKIIHLIIGILFILLGITMLTGLL